MPSENPPARLRAADVSPTWWVEHRADPTGGQTVALGHPQQVVLGAPTGMDRPRVEKGTDLGERRRQRPVRLAADRCRSRVRGVQPEHDAHSRGLTGPVGADEPGDLARAHGEGEVVDGDSAAVPLP